MEGFRRDNAVAVVGHGVEQFERGDGRDRDRGDDRSRPELAERENRHAHGSARGGAVVDDDDGFSGDDWEWTGSAKRRLATPELELLGDDDPLDRFWPNTEVADDVGVEHARPAAGDGAEGELFVTGHAELAHDEDVERCAELFGDSRRDRHAPARQSEDDEGPVGDVLAKRESETTSCVESIDEVRGVQHESLGVNWSTTNDAAPRQWGNP